jgi:putative N6-adenine-specific DNA methylase
MAAAETTYLLFVPVAPGLEGLLVRELGGLGLVARAVVGGAELRSNAAGLLSLCLGSRLAEGVRVRLRSFVARDFAGLEAGLQRLPFAAYVPKGAPLEVRVTCHRSRLWHSGAVEARVLGVLKAEPGRQEEGALGLFVRITGDAVQVSVDAGGYRLHRRGARAHVAAASLRETLAAAALFGLLDAAGAAPRRLWDPFCGAGTLGLEALGWARGELPGRARAFACERYPTWEPALRAALSERWRPELGRFELGGDEPSAAPAFPRDPELEVWLSDHDPKPLAAARHNLAAAGLEAAATVVEGDVEQVGAEVPEGAWVLTNPPYGRRLEEGGALAKLERVLARRRDLRPAGLFVGGPAEASLDARYARAIRTENGGTKVALCVRSR